VGYRSVACLGINQQQPKYIHDIGFNHANWTGGKECYTSRRLYQSDEGARTIDADSAYQREPRPSEADPDDDNRDGLSYVANRTGFRCWCEMQKRLSMGHHR